MGPEFDDLREPLSELQKLRGMTPRAALTKHLLDGDDSLFTGTFDTAAHQPTGGVHAGSAHAATDDDAAQDAARGRSGAVRPRRHLSSAAAGVQSQ